MASTTTVDAVLATPGCLACWDFSEAAGQPRRSRLGGYALIEGAGPIARSDEGVLGTHAAELREGQWLRLPRAELGALDRHGAQSALTVLAWIRRRRKSRPICEAIAGIWDETHEGRQYALFIGAMQAHDRVVGHISAEGGPTPGQPYCRTGSIGLNPVPYDQWCCLGFTYDGRQAASWRDGVLDGSWERNPEPYPLGLHAGQADFTVGAVARTRAPGPYDNFFAGSLGGLAVFDRALEAAVLTRLMRAPESPA